MTLNRIFVLTTIVAVLAGLGLAFAFLGTPSHQRLVSLDEERVRGLQAIAVSLHDHYRDGGLPKVLPASAPRIDTSRIRDFEYRRVDGTHYMLCATFSTNDGDDEDFLAQSEVVWPPHVWRHDAGHHCYKFDVTESEPMPLR